MHMKIKEDPGLAEDIIGDHNGIEMLLFVQYFLNTMRLIVIIFNISFFIGMFWYILCDLSQRLVLNIREGSNLENTNYNTEYFIDAKGDQTDG